MSGSPGHGIHRLVKPIKVERQAISGIARLCDPSIGGCPGAD
jgi:hypothetical protein